MSLKLRPHQKEALSKIENGKILAGDVGSGKSHVGMAYYYTKECGGLLPEDNGGSFGKPTHPKPLIVITTSKKRDDGDWLSIAADFGVTNDPKYSFGGTSIIVDSWNNIAKYQDVDGSFFILDEQRLVGYGAWTKSFLKIVKRNNWIMLSATPGDKWIDYAPVFIGNGFYKNITSFRTEHVVYNTYQGFPKIERYLSVQKLIRLRKSIIVPMPLDRHTTRFRIFVPNEYDEESCRRIFVDRWNIYQNEPITNASQMFTLLRKTINIDESRIDSLVKIMDEKPKIIIFYNFDVELELLRTLETRFDIPVAEWNGHKHEPIPKGDRWLYLVQYASGNEAWECTSTDTMVFWSLNYSFRMTRQCEGRIDRLNTSYSNLFYYYMVTDYWLDRRIRLSHKNKKDFNERDTGLKF